MAALKMLTNAVLNSGQAGRTDSVTTFLKHQQQNTSSNQQSYFLTLYLILFSVFNTFRKDFMQFLQTAHKLSI